MNRLEMCALYANAKPSDNRGPVKATRIVRRSTGESALAAIAPATPTAKPASQPAKHRRSVDVFAAPKGRRTAEDYWT